MAGLGKLTNSLVSVANENTVALVNLSVDFSVFRCDPSPEYLAVGSALTTKRKQEAENGAIHATACKLGFLFHQMLPDTPKLLQAYGTRVCEILSRPGINPEGTEDDGPFRAFIGADCTSIWAAATSGPASISILLLACMLSNAWDAKTATSIWVELIEQRRRNIWAQTEDNKIVHPHSLSAAKQDISRSELANWDASVRSWLRRADVAMRFQHTQLKLIMDNISTPYSTAGSTFEKVTMAWVRAMEVVERLLNNLPQEVSDRAILLAIHSWHLYPDILVFQQEAKKIPFNDTLFPNAGILSVGLEYKGPSDNVTKWSLALSHLRYYGDPVLVRSNDNEKRLHVHQLWLVTLGVIFRQWEVSYANFDEAIAWFQELNKILRLVDMAQQVELSWLIRLCDAASSIKENNGLEAKRLIKYGWRRAKKLLGPDDRAMRCPFFGLCNPYVMSVLTMVDDVDRGVEFMRGIASQLGVEAHEAIILYTAMQDHESWYYEWFTIVPIEAHLGLNNTIDSSHASKIGEKRHIRWLHAINPNGKDVHQTMLEQRCHEIEQKGEICHIAYDKSEMLVQIKKTGRRRYGWERPPRVFSSTGPVEFTRLSSLRQEQYSRFQLLIESSKHNSFGSAHFVNLMRLAAATMASLGQGLNWLRQTPQPQKILQYLKESLRTSHPKPYQGGLKRKAPMDEPTQEEINQYFDFVLRQEGSNEGKIQDDITGCVRLMSSACDQPAPWLMSLRILEVVSHLYQSFPGATVSLRLVEQDLLKAKWLPPPIREILNSPFNTTAFRAAVETPITKYLTAMTRAASFSCIAMFESGYFDIDPDHLNEVIALCSEDSIFVAGIMLSDPGSKAQGGDIRHLVGNVGHSGMVLMVSPLEPRIRAVGHDPELVEHRPFDGKSIDSFGGTSLHLSFTTWKMPLDWQNTGEIDQEIFLLESVVSVQDNGNWVADIDVIDMEKSCPDIIEKFSCDQSCSAADPEESHGDKVSIDSWEELLDPPPCIGIFRAKKNWAARLAAASILVQQGKGYSALIVGDERVCWSCLRDLYAEPEPHLPQLIIY
ncbi:hypothetical protein M431DRAFT_500766 [Trichoderma harzianum CBS 226.95]|uniref:Uncharacterized protein n=1 Tax=Trichoderma harzianum CBS 226.95 TaxID=983964 RepID=A0A2T3ZVT5_TRIHA|nr:hypothetical protein M431DRAFT_500766 [Trichoderma harzianum CBS 226.95]PTB48833.1 hypothetical protein M431DRAFT_500766 [Trichoderma harzianum CBS 226.95]